MKKKILISIFAVAIAAVAGWSLGQSKSEVTFSDVVLSNAEALANIKPPTSPCLTHLSLPYDCGTGGNCACPCGSNDW
ncbi:MAG: NVEALA domain-containing protein [Tannerellaceae bacterium]|jgi:hypothetical protein|nr:NVEALA domain-containing protein [Tannerellaceae bacterium]